VPSLQVTYFSVPRVWLVQVNLEYLARTVFSDGEELYPDSLVGTDSHTTMINGLGVTGWGVGGIEAESVSAIAAQPSSAPVSTRAWLQSLATCHFLRDAIQAVAALPRASIGEVIASQPERPHSPRAPASRVSAVVPVE
jgi:hypothetical protein